MTHTQKRRSSALSLAALLGAAAMAMTACTDTGQSASEPTFSDTLAPSIYCGEDCSSQLQLEADPESIDCSVGVSWSSASFPYGAKSTQQIPAFAEQFFPNMEVTVTDGQGDSTTQASQVSDMIAQGIDVLIISPQDADALAGVVDRAKAEGIEVIAADRQVGTEVATYIGSDNVEAGQVVGEAVVEALGGEGTVVEISGSLGASPTIDRAAGFRTALEGSGVEIIASQTGNYDRAEGLQVMEDLLQRFGPGEIDAVYLHNDQMAFGAIQAIQEAGRGEEIMVFGVDGEGEALEAILDGEYSATVGYPLVVNESILAAAKLCAGEPVDERIVLDSTLINADNVEQYLDNPPQ